MANSTNSSLEYPDLVWTYFHSAQATLFGTIVIGTIVGNFLALYAFVTRKKDLRSPTHFFLANLALADLFVGTLSLPFLATYSVTLRWYFGQSFCTTWTILHFWFCSSSILSTLAVCIERYIGVKYPLKHLRIMNKRVVFAIMVGVWILAAILSAVPLFAWPETPSEKQYECKVNLRLGHVLVATVGIFHLPATAMVILYWQIYREATKVPTIKSGATINASTTLTRDDGNQSRIRQVRLAKKISFLVGFLIISYLPMFTVFLILGFKPDFCPLEVFVLLAWVRYLNSCINPIIYSFSVPGYKKAFKNIFNCWCCKNEKGISQNTRYISSSSNTNATITKSLRSTPVKYQ